MRQAEAAVILLDIARPQLVASKSKPLENPGSAHDIHVLSIGDRGRRRHILLPRLDVATSQVSFPDGRALSSVHTPQIEIASICYVEEDMVTPNNRSGGAPTGHRKLPRYVFLGTPADG